MRCSHCWSRLTPSACEAQRLCSEEPVDALRDEYLQRRLVVAVALHVARHGHRQPIEHQAPPPLIIPHREHARESRVEVAEDEHLCTAKETER